MEQSKETGAKARHKRYRQSGRAADYQREWLNRNPGKRQQYARNWRIRSYGLSIEQYNHLLKEQMGVCAICGKPETKVLNGTVASLAIDHCHDTGAVRGLLCIKCNRSLHDIEWHQSAIRYLRQFS
ncbi:MAG TPA: endonuclease VII domain-containing protein [Anaerovoracaceae bacterium]|nr:endonuclease VII domain-containing protein [Anaerovoracaceae bacterium]